MIGHPETANAAPAGIGNGGYAEGQGNASSFKSLPYRGGIQSLASLSQKQIDWLLSAGVTIDAMIRPAIILSALGERGPDGCFDPQHDGPSWLVFAEPDNLVFWQPRTGALAWWEDRPFALGQHLVDEPATYAMGFPLAIYSDPLAWLVNRRDGIVVLDWSQAFDRLRDIPRVSVCESLMTTYRKAMRPRHLPEVSSFRGSDRRAAA